MAMTAQCSTLSLSLFSATKSVGNYGISNGRIAHRVKANIITKSFIKWPGYNQTMEPSYLRQMADNIYTIFLKHLYS